MGVRNGKKYAIMAIISIMDVINTILLMTIMNVIASTSVLYWVFHCCLNMVILVEIGTSQFSNKRP